MSRIEYVGCRTRSIHGELLRISAREHLPALRGVSTNPALCASFSSEVLIYVLVASRDKELGKEERKKDLSGT